ncbi:MAG TPA: histidine kinase, partial [Candidatus Xenobia bacterium]
MQNPFETLGTIPLAALVDRHPASFLILSEGACICANQAAIRMFGASVVGKSIEDLVQFLPGHAFTLDGQKFLAGMGDRILRGFAYPLLNEMVGATFVDVTEDQRAQRESLALAKMASGFTWGSSLAETMQSLALNAAEALDARAAGVILLEGDPPEPRHAGAFNLPADYVACLAQLWRQPDNLMIQVVQSGDIGVKRNVRRELLSHPAMGPAHSYLLAAPWETVVLVPLIYQGVRLGVLTCYFPACTGRDESELRFLRAIADQAAILVQNARLIEQARDKTLLEERQRLARELHDSVSQALFGIALGARTARTLADQDPTAVKEPL